MALLSHRLVAMCAALLSASCMEESVPPLPNPNGNAHDKTGYSVAIDDNWAMSGVPESDSLASGAGKVLVYRRSGGTWSLLQTLVPETPVAEGGFGATIDLSGDRAIIGALTEAPHGAAYVFERVGNTWSQKARVTGDTLAYYFARTAVAISGDYAFVGAHGPSTTTFSGPGHVYVYKRNSAGAWLRDTTITASDAFPYMEFGASVSIDGDVLVVGAQGGQFEPDASYVFRRSGSAWTEVAKLTPLDTPVHRYFGRSVSIAGNALIVGAPYDSANGHLAGAAYVFERDSSGTWSQVQKLAPSTLTEDDHFGHSVSMDGPQLIVGAAGADGQSAMTGAAFTFRRGLYGWVQWQTLFASDAVYGDAFGSDVSISGECAMVGAPDAEAPPNGGSAYIFCGAVVAIPEVEIDIICCWQPPIPRPVVATVRYRNVGNARVVARRHVEIVSPAGQVLGASRVEPVTLGSGVSRSEQVVVIASSPLLGGRHELRLRWNDNSGERIQRAYFDAPARNEAALRGVTTGAR
jgi:FG-GAP repeat